MREERKRLAEREALVQSKQTNVPQLVLLGRTLEVPPLKSPDFSQENAKYVAD